MSMKRNEYLDYLKGLLISLVVLGHTIQVSKTNFDDSFLFRVIYSFHMPFFFLVSGYLAFSQLEKKGISFLSFKRKVVMLLIPFIGWYLIYNVGTIYSSSSSQPIYVLFQSLEDLFSGVDLGLWYLWVLLLMYVIIFCSFKIIPQAKFSILVCFLSALLLPMTNIAGIYLLKWYLIFFVVGGGVIIFATYIESLKRYLLNLNRNIIYFFIITTYIIAMQFWSRTINDSEFFYDNKYYFQLFKLVTAIMGITLFNYLSSCLYEKGVLKDIIIDLGRNSLGIYILNFLVISVFISFSHKIPLGNDFLLIFVFTFSLFASHFISRYLSKVMILNFLFGAASREQNGQEK